MERITAMEFKFTTVQVDEQGSVVEERLLRAQMFFQILSNDLSLEMVLIPGGSFMMGSPEGQGYEDEHPAHFVRLAPFWMSKTPITQSQWQALMGRKTTRFSGDQLPVDSVSWGEADRFCSRLARNTGRGFRLPSEAQWEYACRAGAMTPFSFGHTLTTDLANYNGEFVYRNGPKGIYRHCTTEVGIFPANAFGLLDMHGNVWEWTADAWHADYLGAPIGGSPWETGRIDEFRVARGGSWHDTPDVCRSAARLKAKASDGDEFMGFRVILPE